MKMFRLTVSATNSITRMEWKSFIRTIAGWLYYHTRLFALHLWWCRRVGRKVLVLNFHRVLPKNSPVFQYHLSLRTIIVTLENFEQVVHFLKRHFHFLSLREFGRRVQNSEKFQHSYCIITFDDGYDDAARYAWPVLQAGHLPFTIFLPTALVGTATVFWWDRLYHLCMNGACASQADAGPVAALLGCIAQTPAPQQRQRLIYQLIDLLQDWTPAEIQILIDRLAAQQDANDNRLEHANALMKWDDVTLMKNNGVHFGSHTRHHLNIAHTRPEVLHDEVVLSKSDLEAMLHESIDAFAYPEGHLSDDVVAMVAQAGYAQACGTCRGLNRPGEDNYCLRRNNVWDGMLQDFRGRFSPGVFALNLMR